MYGTPPYHAPFVHGTKSRSFRSFGEMSQFLTSKDSTLSWHNFSFRKEPMQAPRSQEIVRGARENIEIFPEKNEPPPPPPKPKGRTSVFISCISFV